MSSIHYFQRYSQPENVATNNTLLLLSRLYHESPNKFKGFLNDFLDDNDIEAGIQFNQQRKGKNSIPDGSLTQVSFKIVIETKLHQNFSLEQLREHLSSFGKEQYQVLFSLSPQQPSNNLKLQIEDTISTYNRQNDTSIKYLPATFQDIVAKFNNCLEDHNYELIEIINDFEAYCIHYKLITAQDERMRIVPCGWTLKENFQFNLYYAPVNRGFSEHNYLGIYSDKSVQGIGKIENIITAHRLSTGELEITNGTTDVTPEQTNNIIGVIAAAQTNNNWDIATGHRFFCVEKFYHTDFRKTTKYPLQGSKFFHLKDLLKITTLPKIEEIAEKLKSIEW